MRMMVEKKKSIVLIIILLTIVVIFICGRYYFAHNKSYKNEAIEKVIIYILMELDILKHRD